MDLFQIASGKRRRNRRSECRKVEDLASEPGLGYNAPHDLADFPNPLGKILSKTLYKES